MTLVAGLNSMFYCEHCKQVVTESTFYEHRALYGSLSEETLDLSSCCPQGELRQLESDEELSNEESEYFEDEA